MKRIIILLLPVAFALSAPLFSNATNAAAGCAFQRDIFAGVTHEDIRCLQKYLNSSGYQVSQTGPGSPGNESNYFGFKTQAAVVRWQAEHGITPVRGYFGPKSRAKYTSLITGTSLVTTPKNPQSIPTPSPILTPTSTLLSPQPLPLPNSSPPPSFFQVLSPNGGETWQIGSTQTVSWSGAIPIEYSMVISLTDGPTPGILRYLQTIPTSDSYQLQIPTSVIQGDVGRILQAGSYKLEINIYDGPQCLGLCPPGPQARVVFHDQSDAPFSVAASTYNYDFDKNGVNDTNLKIASCGSGICLDIDSSLAVKSNEVKLSDTPVSYGCDNNNFQGVLIRLIGDYDGDGVSEVSALFCKGPNIALAVVNAAAGKVIGYAALPPPAQAVSYSDSVKDPSGKFHPFLANGYGYNDSNYLCIFRPDLASSPECGPGFSKVNASPANIPKPFRNSGGFTQDLDGDGWEDINILYEWVTVAVSPRTLSKINEIKFDVSKADEPNSPPEFTSGRQYGTHSAVTSATGKLRDVMVGGIPVGTFDDPKCNTSRFVGVLESNPGDPSSRILKWARYFGFHSSIFSAMDPVGIDTATILRPADMMNRCIHRFSDSRSTMGNTEVDIVNYFKQSAPVDTCIPEQRLYYKGNQDPWQACILKNLKSKGVWGMRVIRESNGATLTGSLNSYIWGKADNFYSTAEPVYLVEILPDSEMFDLSDQPPPKLQARTIGANGLWNVLGTFPITGRPLIKKVPPSSSRGLGIGYYYAELTTSDRDEDGFMDVQLTDGSWVGYSKTKGTLVVK